MTGLFIVDQRRKYTTLKVSLTNGLGAQGYKTMASYQREPIGNHLRRHILDRDGFTCVYCGEPIEKTPHIDHLVPVSAGGKNHICNLAASCPSCNLSKGARIDTGIISTIRPMIVRREINFGCGSWGNKAIEIDDDLWAMVHRMIICREDKHWMYAVERACLLSPYAEDRGMIILGLTAMRGLKVD